MGNNGYWAIKHLKMEAEKDLKKAFPNLTNESGIYILTRKDEENNLFVYVGQAIRGMARMVSHLTGYSQRIDMSLRKHGLYSIDNPYGWKCAFKCVAAADLDKEEQNYIFYYQNVEKCTMYNITGGGQIDKLEDINERKESKGYREGLKQGEKNAKKKIAEFFEKYFVIAFKQECYAKNGSLKLVPQAKEKEFYEYLKVEE